MPRLSRQLHCWLWMYFWAKWAVQKQKRLAAPLVWLNKGQIIVISIILLLLSHLILHLNKEPYWITCFSFNMYCFDFLVCTRTLVKGVIPRKKQVFSPFQWWKYVLRYKKKYKMLKNFASIFLLFLPFSAFLHKQTLKKQFWPVFGVYPNTGQNKQQTR